ncbi:MAG TPA: response regulator receiver protein [Ruminococcaceae bacterium]|nr:response regulator receiver protein [Oscillospiraceae bacterium]
MVRALIVCKQQETAATLSSVILSVDYFSIDAVSSADEARRRAQMTDYSLVLINTPLPDEFGNDLALDMVESGLTGVLLLVKADITEQVQNSVGNCGVFVISKPINPVLLAQSIRFVMAHSQKIIELKEQNKKLQQKLEDTKIVDRAKCLLIQYLGMTEQQAHRHIQKNSMDSRVPPRVIAENILKTYEN